MKPNTYTVVIPVLNQLRFTRQCVESLIAGGTPPGAVLVIDNASTDDTATWLAREAGVPSLTNRVNLGCGGAWAQGSFHSTAEWVVLLNNDVLVPPGGMDDLLAAAESRGFDVVSPGLLEGELDYDFATFAPQYVREMNGVSRSGWFHGVCFAVRRRVFETVGFPDTDRQLGGHEDKEFLVRCLRHGVPVGTVGSSVLHHFGSITQKAMKKESGAKSLGDRHHAYRRMGMGWWARKKFKTEQRRQVEAWSKEESAAHGMTLHMLRDKGGWRHV